jgi:hypothetical protein
LWANPEGNEQEAGKGMQIFLRQLARPQAQADALRLQPVGEDFLALPDEAVEEADNVDERDSSAEGLLHTDLEDEHLSEEEDDDDEASDREGLEGKGEKNKLPYWLIITPEDSRINGPRVRLRFQRGRLTPEEARAVVMRAERSIAHLVRRVNQEILLWYVLTAKFFALLLLSSLPPCQRRTRIIFPQVVAQDVALLGAAYSAIRERRKGEDTTQPVAGQLHPSRRQGGTTRGTPPGRRFLSFDVSCSE